MFDPVYCSNTIQLVRTNDYSSSENTIYQYGRIVLMDMSTIATTILTLIRNRSKGGIKHLLGNQSNKLIPMVITVLTINKQPVDSGTLYAIL